MVYLTCAVIGLGGQGVIKTWTEVAARVRLLYMLTSDLTSLVPPQFSHLAASEESWHRFVFFFFYSQACFMIRKPGEARKICTNRMLKTVATTLVIKYPKRVR